MPLTEALERDLKAYSADKDARPFRYSVGSFVETCGDLGVTHIERRHVTDWLAPSNGTVYRLRRSRGDTAPLRRWSVARCSTLAATGFKMTEGDGTTKRVPFNKAMLELTDAYHTWTAGASASRWSPWFASMRATGALDRGQRCAGPP